MQDSHKCSIDPSILTKQFLNVLSNKICCQINNLKVNQYGTLLLYFYVFSSSVTLKSSNVHSMLYIHLWLPFKHMKLLVK